MLLEPTHTKLLILKISLQMDNAMIKMMVEKKKSFQAVINEFLQ